MQEASNSLKLVAKGGMIVFLGVILSKVFSYLYRIIISRLGPNDYGLLSIAFAVFGILGGITMLGTENGLVRFISGYEQKKESIKGVIFDSMRFVLPLSIVLGIMLFFSADYIAINIFKNESLGILLKIMAFFVPVNALRKIFLNSLIGFKKVEYETAAKALTENISKVIVTLLLVLLGYKIYGAMAAYAISILISLLVAFYLLRYKVFNFLDRSIKAVYSTREYYSYSLPLLFSIMVFIFILWVDTLLLGYFKTSSDVGLYNAAMPTAQLLFLFPNALMTMFLPVASSVKNFSDAEFIMTFKAVTKWVFLINIVPLAIFLLYSRQVISILFSSVYSQASLALVILSIGFFISYLALSSNMVLLALNRTRLVFMNNLIAAILNLVLNLILIPKYSFVGAAIATSSSFIVMGFLMFIESYALTKIIPFKINYLWIIASIAAPLFLLRQAVEKYSLVDVKSIVLVSFALVSLYGIFLLLTKSLEKEDYAILKSAYHRIGIRIGFIDNLFGRLE